MLRSLCRSPGPDGICQGLLLQGIVDNDPIPHMAEYTTSKYHNTQNSTNHDHEAQKMAFHFSHIGKDRVIEGVTLTASFWLRKTATFFEAFSELDLQITVFEILMVL